MNKVVVTADIQVQNPRPEPLVMLSALEIKTLKEGNWVKHRREKWAGITLAALIGLVGALPSLATGPAEGTAGILALAGLIVLGSLLAGALFATAIFHFDTRRASDESAFRDLERRINAAFEESTNAKQEGRGSQKRVSSSRKKSLGRARSWFRGVFPPSAPEGKSDDRQDAEPRRPTRIQKSE